MGYIVKLIPEDLYLIPSDCEIGLTESRSKAMEKGVFHDYGAAKANAKLFNKDMVRDVDYIIESCEKE